MPLSPDVVEAYRKICREDIGAQVFGLVDMNLISKMVGRNVIPECRAAAKESSKTDCKVRVYTDGFYEQFKYLKIDDDLTVKLGGGL